MDFIHIGLHKTATTYLQKEFFPKLGLKYFSCEELSCSAKLLYTNRYNDWNEHMREFILLGIYEKYGENVKIIIGVRNKDKWKKSLYNQVVRSTSYFKSFKSFCNLKNSCYVNDYVKYAEFLFGDNLYIFNYDKFKVDAQKELDKLTSYLGVDRIIYEDKRVNISSSRLKLNLLRLLNLFYEFVKLKLILSK